ncbi:hypothetical protein CVT25_014242 [Psilocybe cyanescens]|uniref:Uncharacterized protein n=1 Tax=Psilocybe cyanescens TaxID=93625 RepID=A0A409XJP9_PSICY|nr:hypothetical protein CVT25_014242 [Psilocybe cyanescens]
MARDDVLRSASGRIILMQGGIAGRLAAELVAHHHVLNGPTLVDMEQVGYYGNIQFVDDRICMATLDIVCGVYHVSETRSGGFASHSSWWPTQSTWMYNTGLAGDQWLPDAEDFYVKRRTVFEADQPQFELKKSSVWKDMLNLRKRTTRCIISSSEEWARTYIATSERFR